MNTVTKKSLILIALLYQILLYGVTPPQYQWITVHNTRIYSILVFVTHKFSGLCTKTVRINAEKAVPNVCYYQEVKPGETFEFRPKVGSALQESANSLIIMVWDPNRQLLLQRGAEWGTRLEYPYPHFPYVQEQR